MQLPESIENLVNEFSRLPGIGGKSARRLVFHLLSSSHGQMEQLAMALDEAGKKIIRCARCNSFAETSPCPMCTDPRRDDSLLCVVEKASDVLIFEQSGSFRGRYFVLGGHLSPLDGIGPSDLHIPQLVDLVRSIAPKEVILSMGSGTDAEATAHYIDRVLDEFPVKRTRLARGIPVGHDLEYVDEMTMMRAFESRTKI